jgi:hypothetical protein
VAAGAVNGRWSLPSTGVEQPLAFLARPETTGVARVLWLGDPRALPVGGWSVEPGLSYALTGEALPTADDVWAPAGPGPAQRVTDAIHLAITGGTIHLGRLLAPAGIRYVVVVDSLAPAGPSTTASVDAPPPPDLQRALLNQNDLVTVPGEFGVQVYKNTEIIPVTAQRAAPLAANSKVSWPSAADIAGWSPALQALDAPHGATGDVGRGTVVSGYAPAGDFDLTEHGTSLPRQAAFGWAGQYRTSAGTATLSFQRLPFIPLGVALELLAWLALAAALFGWRGWPLRRAPAEPPVAVVAAEEEAP